MTRAQRWRHRATYVSVMAVFFGLLAWTGAGRTRNADALQRQLSVHLQGVLLDVEYRNLASGTILATGHDVFRLLDTQPAWYAYSIDERETPESLARELAAPLREDRAAIAAWEAAGRPLDQLVVLPLPLMHFGAEMTAALAAQHLAVTTIGDLPAYLLLRSADGDGGSPASAAHPPTLHPVTRAIAEELAATNAPGESMGDFIRTLAVRQQRAYAPALDAWHATARPDDGRPHYPMFLVPAWLDTDVGRIPALALFYDGIDELGAPPIAAYREAVFAGADSPTAVTLVEEGQDHIPAPSEAATSNPALLPARWQRGLAFQRSVSDGLWRVVQFTGPPPPPR